MAARLPDQGHGGLDGQAEPGTARTSKGYRDAQNWKIRRNVHSVSGRSRSRKYSAIRADCK